jgi:hypothetical protein
LGAVSDEDLEQIAGGTPTAPGLGAVSTEELEQIAAGGAAPNLGAVSDEELEQSAGGTPAALPPGFEIGGDGRPTAPAAGLRRMEPGGAVAKEQTPVAVEPGPVREFEPYVPGAGTSNVNRVVGAGVQMEQSAEAEAPRAELRAPFVKDPRVQEAWEAGQRLGSDRGVAARFYQGLIGTPGGSLGNLLLGGTEEYERQRAAMAAGMVPGAEEGSFARAAGAAARGAQC